MKSISLEEDLSTANHKLLVFSSSFVNLPFCCCSPVPFLQSAQNCSPFLSPPSHAALHAALFRGSSHTAAHRSFLPAEAFRFPPCPAPFHRHTGFVPTTADGVLISQAPAGSTSIVQ